MDDTVFCSVFYWLHLNRFVTYTRLKYGFLYVKESKEH